MGGCEGEVVAGGCHVCLFVVCLYESWVCELANLVTTTTDCHATYSVHAK